MKRRAHPWVIYTAGLIGIIVASYLAANGAFAIYSQLPDDTQRSWWTVYVLNYLAPFLGGIIVAPLTAGVLTRRSQFVASVRGHFLRAISWYLFAGWVTYIIVRNHDNGDFGLWSQLIVWPLAGTIGAMILDLTITYRRRASSRLPPKRGVVADGE